jgi:NADPH-dependent curcumin reductase CurA
MKNRRVVLAAYLDGAPKESDFRLEEADVPELADGQVLVRNSYVTIDPGMRGRLSGQASYTAALPLGAVLGSASVGQVVTSKNPKYSQGDWVAAAFGWQEYGVGDGPGMRKVTDLRVPISAQVGVLGIPGLTAYFGLLDIGQPKAGETVLVSTAAGAVGSAAGQIAKIKGCRVVGIAGGPAKCRLLTEDYGFDGAIDRLAEPDIAAAVARECPDGVDVYFDNVGGAVLDAVLPLMRVGGRIVASGHTADYNVPVEQRRGLKNTTCFITHRLKMQGLVVFDSVREYPRAWAEMTDWILDGRLKYREDVEAGLERAPAAFIGLFKGENFGRKLIKLD